MYFSQSYKKIFITLQKSDANCKYYETKLEDPNIRHIDGILCKLDKSSESEKFLPIVPDTAISEIVKDFHVEQKVHLTELETLNKAQKHYSICQYQVREYIGNHCRDCTNFYIHPQMYRGVIYCKQASNE